MKTRSSRSLVLSAVLALIVALPATAHAVAPANTMAPATSIGPKSYYLALGDSLAYGFQPNINILRGYAGDFFRSFSSAGQSHMINMACPDESTATVINGGCPFTKYLKYKYSGPQLDAAVRFIQQHPGQVSPVTIDIGGNDILPLMNTATCTISTTQSITQIVTAFDSNFNTVLSTLKAALNGTGDLFTMNYYMPYQNKCPNLMPYLLLFNSQIQAVAQKNGVPVADVFTAFGGAISPNPHICAYTWICAKNDVHPTTQGYRVIARTFTNLAGYKRHLRWPWLSPSPRA